MFIRYFCKVQPDSPSDSFGALGFEYFKAIKAADIPVRVLATNVADFSAGSGRWAPYNESLVRAIPDMFINVVCGGDDEVIRLFTIGAPNIAIVALYDGAPGEKALKYLRDYNLVICPREDDAMALHLLGVTTSHQGPDPDVLRSIFEEFETT